MHNQPAVRLNWKKKSTISDLGKNTNQSFPKERGWSRSIQQVISSGSIVETWLRQDFRTYLNIIEIQTIDESLHIDIADQTEAKSTPNRAMTRTDQQPGRRHSYRWRLPESITVKTNRTEAFNRNSNLSINHSISELVKGFLREYRDLS